MANEDALDRCHDRTIFFGGLSRFRERAVDGADTATQELRDSCHDGLVVVVNCQQPEVDFQRSVDTEAASCGNRVSPPGPSNIPLGPYS